MARQNRRATVHFDDGFGSVCAVDGDLSTDPLAVYCGRCERLPVFLEAYAAERRAARTR